MKYILLAFPLFAWEREFFIFISRVSCVKALLPLVVSYSLSISTVVGVGERKNGFFYPVFGYYVQSIISCHPRTLKRKREKKERVSL